jgi:hypothetical protein
LLQMSPNRSLRIWTGDPHLKWAFLSQSSCPWSWNHDLQPPTQDKRSSWGDGWFHVNFLVHFKWDSEMWVVKECAEWLIDWHPIGYQLFVSPSSRYFPLTKM